MDRLGYKYLADLSWADAAFEAEGESIEELFRNSVDALLGIMIRDPQTIRPEVRELAEFEVRDPDSRLAYEKILHRVLEDVIFFKDSSYLLMRLAGIELIRLQKDVWLCKATFSGDRISPDEDALGTDVKAVTWHRFKVEKLGKHWTATVLLDV